MAAGRLTSPCRCFCFNRSIVVDIIKQIVYNINEKKLRRLLMTTSEQIRVLCVRSGVSLSELARRINQTPQNFNAKLKRNTITQDELNQIAKALNVTYEQYFVLGNGELVK